MGEGIKVGDRVRLTVRNRQPSFRPGDKGIVLSGPHASSRGEDYYVVRMGNGPADRPLVFMRDEIERDV